MLFCFKSILVFQKKQEGETPLYTPTGGSQTVCYGTLVCHESITGVPRNIYKLEIFLVFSRNFIQFFSLKFKKKVRAPKFFLTQPGNFTNSI